jgi:predicted AlkP superfamily phosphohydrolase/phosphomutase
MPYRILLIGLDGATFDVIRPLIAAGRMPNLARLMREGASAPMRSTCPPVSAPAWVTFLTGKNPGRHGVFNFQNFDPRRYGGFNETLVNSSHFRGGTLLDALADTGTRCFCYRVPMTYPPWPISGVLVSGPPVPDRRVAYVAPAEVDLGPPSTLSHDDLAAARRGRDVETIDRCNAYELDLLERTGLRAIRDGFEIVVLFTGIPDGLQHPFWRFHDATSPLHDPAAPAALRDIIRRWYATIDGVVGRLCEALDEHWAVIVLSDHGGGPAPIRHVNLNAWLATEGYLAGAGASRALAASVARRTAERIRIRLPGRMWLKRHLPERLKARFRRLRSATAAIDWTRTRAYAVPVFYPVTGINLNVRGRQPHGIVEAGAEYDALRAELAERLTSVEDPATGQRLVTGVWRREEIYAGPHVEVAPDLIAYTAAGYHGGYDVARVVTPVPPAALEQVNGSHTPEGIFVAAGGPFRAGATLDPVELCDVLPTAFYLSGTPIPDDLDGRVRLDAIVGEYAAAAPVQLRPGRGKPNGTTSLSADEEAEMKKFLQGLGYIE